MTKKDERVGRRSWIDVCSLATLKLVNETGFFTTSLLGMKSQGYCDLNRMRLKFKSTDTSAWIRNEQADVSEEGLALVSQRFNLYLKYPRDFSQ